MKLLKYTPIFWMLTINLLIGAGLSSCDDDDNKSAQVIWVIDLNSKLENPGVDGRDETGTLQMTLYNDNSLVYSFQVNNLKSGDVLTMAHIHAGDPLTNGPVVLDFNPVFSGNSASGTLMPRESFIDSLLNSQVELYFNIHSQQVPGGLLRGQVNSDILLASDITLDGASEVPPVSTSATGMASVRLASNKQLYSKVMVSGLESGDSWTAAHIHTGASGQNGAVLVPLCDNESDFGVKKITTLSNETINTLLKDSTYINAHSVLHSSGTIRGQVKNESKFHYHY